MRFILYLVLVSISFHSIGQQTDSVDFLKGSASIGLDPEVKRVYGKVKYTFNILQPTKSIFVDAQQMKIEEVKLDGSNVAFEYEQKKISIASDFKSKSNHTVEITFSTKPKKALYFIKDYNDNHQIWTQGQGKYTSNWLPSFDDMNEKVEFDLTVSFDNEYEVIANGKLIKKESNDDLTQSWYYDMQKPMSSYLVAIAIGKYNKKTTTSNSGIPLEMYYYPEDEDRFESTYRHNKLIFDFLEKEIGYTYPWQNYKQIPVKDFLYAGMENTGTTIFSDAFVVDSIGYTDRNYINVNAHELAHQWFGDLITETEGKHHWLQEGFATYYALLAEREIFGEEYFQYKLYESAEQLIGFSQKRSATSLLDPKASSLTFYQRGAWALHALQNLVGKGNFKIIIHNYLEKHKFRNVTTDDFLAIAEEVSGKDLTIYKKLWLENVQFPAAQSLDILTKSSFIKQYLSLAKERTQPLIGKLKAVSEALDFPINDYLAQEAVYQLQGDTSPEAISLYQKAFNTNNVIVRQAIANTMAKIPENLKNAYESLLSDASYATVEPALYNLWNNFPNDRNKYLDLTKNSIGFNDKNVRILWLALALNTPSYHKEKHTLFYNELSEYTSPKYHFSLRKNVFSYLDSLQTFTSQSLMDLVDACIHHNWRFRNYSRKLLEKMLKESRYKDRYMHLLDLIPTEQREYLKKKLSV